MPKTKPAKKSVAKTTATFLPRGYELPKPKSAYVTLEEGDNRLRILTHAAIGWEAWIDGVAHRTEGQEHSFDEDSIDIGEYGPKLYHFWAFLVWNADLKKVQIWQVSQRTILISLLSMLNQKEWGDPRNYGLIVTKTVVKKKTEYKVVGVPHKPLGEDVKDAFASTTLSLDKIFADQEEVEPSLPAKGEDF